MTTKALVYLIRRPCTFKKADVTRAVSAVMAAGIEAARVEIGTDGRIVVIIKTQDGSELGADLDQWMKKHHADPA
jgi:hypothetical protein